MSEELAIPTKTKSQFLAGVGQLAPVDAFPEDWDIEKKEQHAKELAKKPLGSRMYQSIPCICHSGTCIDRAQGHCDLSETPDGHRCPYEKALLDMLLKAFLEELLVSDDEDFQISVFSLARDYVDVEMQIMRIQGEFSLNPEFIIDQDIYGKEGDLITTQRVENPMQIMYDRLANRKQRILKTLAATREQKLKINSENENQSNIKRVAQVMSRIADHLESNGEIDCVSDEEDIVDAFIDVDYTIIEPDSEETVPESQE